MINFYKYRWFCWLISITIIIIGLYSIYKHSFRFSIEFTGGTNIELLAKNRITQKENDILKAISNNYKVNYFKIINRKIILTTPSLKQNEEKKIVDLLEKKLSQKLEIIKLEKVGPIIGKEMVKKTIVASVLAIFGILIYMFFSFKGFNYGLAAILAMIHDLLIVFGSYSLLSHFFGAQFDTMFVTAALTTLSFSIHDTIVIFDKVRDYLMEYQNRSIESLANLALTETMIRSLNNSMTIIFMLLALVVLGGSTIRFFVLALLIGTLAGTYSSPFVATPILVWLEKNKKK